MAATYGSEGPFPPPREQTSALNAEFPAPMYRYVRFARVRVSAYDGSDARPASTSALALECSPMMLQPNAKPYAVGIMMIRRPTADSGRPIPTSAPCHRE